MAETHNVYDWEYPNYTLHDIAGDHRDGHYYNLVLLAPSRDVLVGVIDGLRVVICKVSFNDDWWIVPQAGDDEPNMDDIGPFETMGDAILHLKLYSTEIIQK